MYSLNDYCNMLMDDVRRDAYVTAMRQAIKPGNIVLDLGAGAGFFSILASQFGARKVYAIECNDSVELGTQLAAANSCQDRIAFIKGLSTKVNLPERVDVIVADLRGSLPLYYGSAASLIDARQRFLKPKGILLPQRDTIFAALVEAPDWYEKNIHSLVQSQYGVDQSVFHRILCNQFYKGRVAEAGLLTSPQSWVTLEYATIDKHDFAGTLRWQVTRDGIAHGISLWFEAEIGASAKFSTAPFLPERTYGNPLLALEKPVNVKAGDEVIITISATLVDEEYVWRWDTKIIDIEGEAKADYQQSTFFGTIFSPLALRKQTANFIPSLNEQGALIAYILSQMNGRNSLQTIATTLCEQFPQHFSTWQQAMSLVGKVAKDFSQ